MTPLSTSWFFRLGNGIALCGCWVQQALLKPCSVHREICCAYAASPLLSPAPDCELDSSSNDAAMSSISSASSSPRSKDRSRHAATDKTPATAFERLLKPKPTRTIAEADRALAALKRHVLTDGIPDDVRPSLRPCYASQSVDAVRTVRGSAVCCHSCAFRVTTEGGGRANHSRPLAWKLFLRVPSALETSTYTRRVARGPSPAVRLAFSRGQIKPTTICTVRDDQK